jgi:hypothetical protein
MLELKTVFSRPISLWIIPDSESLSSILKTGTWATETKRKTAEV